MSTHIANIKVTSKDVIKNWWKLNYFDGGGNQTYGFGLLYKAQIANNPLFPIPGWKVPNGSELADILTLINLDTLMIFPLVAGYRGANGIFYPEVNHFVLWSGEAEDGSTNFNIEVDIPSGGSSEAHDYDYGFSVRLIKEDGIDPGSVSDIDGNIYETIVIGPYVLLKKNYRVTRFTNGTPIPHITDGALWMADSDGAYCFFNNDPNTV